VHSADWQTFNRYRIDVDASHTCTIANASTTPPTSVKIDDFGSKGLADGIHDLTLVAFNSADNQCHFADAFVFVDTTKPSPVAQLTPGSGVDDLLVHWGGDDSGGSGIKNYRVSVTTGGRQIFSTTAGRSKTARIPAQRGKAYALTVTATDFAGNIRSSTASLVDDAGLSLSGRWSRVFATGDYAGATSLTSRSGASAAASLTGRVYVVYVVECAACGKASVSVDGRRIKTIDTYATHTRRRVAVKIFHDGSDQRRRLVIRALGSRNSRSAGTDVYLDALTARG
jgi:hypothetical protein